MAKPYADPWISPRLKIAALWVSMLFVFVYVDLFSLYRADVRADLDAGTLSGFDVGQSFLLGISLYVIVPSLMVVLSLVLPARAARLTNIVLAGPYLITVVASAFDDWAYFVVGSAVEAVLLSAIAWLAWTWPSAPPGFRGEQ